MPSPTLLFPFIAKDGIDLQEIDNGSVGLEVDGNRKEGSWEIILALKSTSTLKNSLFAVNSQP